MGATILIAQGYRHLEAGEYPAAADDFRAALGAGHDGSALAGLAEALWWQRDVEAAIAAKEHCYGAYRRAGDDASAALAAGWVARERLALDSDASVVEGWLARAREAAEGAPATVGWVRLAQAEADRRGGAMADLDAAVALARQHRDPDLECVALARRGVLRIAEQDPDQGIADLNSAMAGATSGETRDPRTLAEAYCALTDAAELLGGSEQLTAWSKELLRGGRLADLGPLQGFGAGSPSAALSAFCGACCGGIFLATGRLDEAEQALRTAITELQRTGRRSRCVHPAAVLAELRIVQGRRGEAAALLAEIEDLPESVRPLAALNLAEGDAASAEARLRRGLKDHPEGAVVTMPARTLLVDALLARGERDAAAAESLQIAAIATRTRSVRHAAEAHLAAGKTAPDPAAAAEEFRRAAVAFSQAGVPLQAARARLLLARSVVEADRGAAVAEARSARAVFHRLGAAAEEGEAAAFLRGLGVHTGPGQRNVGLLTAREREVLALVAEGLSNPEIGQRLFISSKTAGHHVSSILQKLGLRSRTEAAAFAVVSASATGDPE